MTNPTLPQNDEDELRKKIEAVKTESQNSTLGIMLYSEEIDEIMELIQSHLNNLLDGLLEEATPADATSGPTFVVPVQAINQLRKGKVDERD